MDTETIVLLVLGVLGLVINIIIIGLFIHKCINDNRIKEYINRIEYGYGPIQINEIETPILKTYRGKNSLKE